jgi:hypothetical protein
MEVALEGPAIVTDVDAAVHIANLDARTAIPQLAVNVMRHELALHG